MTDRIISRQRPSAEIGIFGPSSAGKTSYLACLWKECALNSWFMVPQNENAIQFVKAIGPQILQGRFAPSTSEARLYHFRIYRPQKRWGFNPPAYDLKLWDGPGGYVKSDIERAAAEYYEHLAKSDAILIMMDTNTFGVDDDELAQNASLDTRPLTMDQLIQGLLNLITHLKHRGDSGAIEVLAAFCATKADSNDAWEYLNSNTNECQFIRNTVFRNTGPIGETPFDNILNRFAPDRRKCFVVSVVGRYTGADGKTHPNLLQRGNSFEIFDKTAWHSYQVLKPIEWILSKLDAQTPWWKRGRGR